MMQIRAEDSSHATCVPRLANAGGLMIFSFELNLPLATLMKCNSPLQIARNLPSGENDIVSHSVMTAEVNGSSCFPSCMPVGHSQIIACRDPAVANSFPSRENAVRVTNCD